MKIRCGSRLRNVAVALVLFASGLRPVAAQPLGSEFQVNSYTTSYQERAAVAVDGSGNFVVVWQSFGDQDGSYFGVFGQRFDSLGSPLGSEFQINSYATGSQARVRVATRASGDFVVVWASLGNDGSDWGVFGQRFDPAGNPAGTEFPVNTYTTDTQDNPALAADDAGNFVVVWRSLYQDGDGSGVFGQRFDSSGGPVGTEFLVNTFTSSFQFNPEVGADASGNFVVVWEGDDQDGSNLGVFAQRFASSGSPVGTEFLVNSFTTGNQYHPALASGGSGNFVVVWESSQGGPDNDVVGQRFDSTGVPLGGEFRVNSFTTNGQLYPAVAADSSGNFVVAWSGWGSNEEDGVFVQQFDAAGNALASELQLNSFTTGNQFEPSVAWGDSGHLVVAWSGAVQDGDGLDVAGRRVSSAVIFAGAAAGFENGSLCGWSSFVGSPGICP